MSEVYSYHTFILPFTWRTNGNEYDKFVKCFDDNVNWTNTDMKDSNDITSANTIDTDVERILLYKEYQYFHPYVRKAIYGFDEGIVHNYSFMYDEIHNKATYVMTKNDDKYVLSINAIRLKIYNTGVALFIIEGENRIESQRNIASVKAINELGRRVTLPYIADNFLCADSLTIDIPGVGTFTENYKQIVDFSLNDSRAISMTHMSDFIKNILGYGSIFDFVSRKIISANTFYVYPLIDDRMYVQCAINSPYYVQEILENDDATGKRAYEINQSISEDLYELIYIDKQGECSCRNDEMREQLIKKSLFDRWINYSSLYAITDYSFVFLSDNPPDHLIESFLTQYFQMICIALAQRSSVHKFKREVAALASGFEKRGKSLDKASITKIMDLQERFVAFDAQLCFSEVSPEQQGIEIFDILKEATFLEKEKDSLKEQLGAVSEAANSSVNFSINKVMLIFTWISGIIAFIAMIISVYQITGISEILTSYPPENGCAEYRLWLFNFKWISIWVVLSVMACIVATVGVLIAYRRRKK